MPLINKIYYVWWNWHTWATVKIKNDNNSSLSFRFPWFLTLTIFENYVKRRLNRCTLPGMTCSVQCNKIALLSGENSADVTKYSHSYTWIYITVCQSNSFLFQLIKVEGGLCEGEVIYHDLVKKTPEEIAKINKRREEKR